MESWSMARGRIRGAKISHVRLSDMANHFSDKAATEKRMEKNPEIYRVFEVKKEGLSFAATTIFPGRIGREFFMTRGHAHKNPSPEVYMGISGKGLLLLEKEGFKHAVLEKDAIAYVPLDAMHRVANVGKKELVFVAFYITEAGHDYECATRHGFSKMVLARNGGWRLAPKMGKGI